MAEQKRVKIFCEYNADGVWGDAGLDDLPVTDDLKERIRAWQRWFEKEARYGEEYLRPIFSAEGLEIAREVKRQMVNASSRAKRLRPSNQ